MNSWYKESVNVVEGEIIESYDIDVVVVFDSADVAAAASVFWLQLLLVLQRHTCSVKLQTILFS